MRRERTPVPRPAGRLRPFSSRAAVVSAGVVCGVVLLAGCTGQGNPSPSPTQATGSASPSATPTATPTPTPTSTGPALVPDGDAAANLEWFSKIVNHTWDRTGQIDGKLYVDALAEGGFAKVDMEVTESVTPIGIPADNIQVSVRWDGECLVGQVGASIGDPVTVVMPELSTGKCLVGQTRAIDW